MGILLLVCGTATSVIGSVGMIFSRTAALATGLGKALLLLPDRMDTLYIKALYAKDGIVKMGEFRRHVRKNACDEWHICPERIWSQSGSNGASGDGGGSYGTARIDLRRMGIYGSTVGEPDHMGCDWNCGVNCNNHPIME